MYPTKHLLLALLTWLACTTVSAADFPTVHPDSVIAKYGRPDRVESTEHDRPRPPIVTRMLEYRKERVRFVFFPDAPAGSPPPYRSWKLMGVQDTRDNSVLTASETTRRMSGRARR
jgi:hypothetical protein